MSNKKEFNPDEPPHIPANIIPANIFVAFEIGGIFVAFEINGECFTVEFEENGEVNFSKCLSKIVPDADSFIENLKRVIRLDELWDRYDERKNCFY